MGHELVPESEVVGRATVTTTCFDERSKFQSLH